MITSTPRTPNESEELRLLASTGKWTAEPDERSQRHEFDTTCTVYGRIELTRVDDDCWRLCDRTLPHNDPRRLIALAELKLGHVTVLWLRERDGHDQFASLEQALKAAEDSIYDVESEQPERPTQIPHFPPPGRDHHPR